ncbi:MAG: class I SAM-dependent methyltransferase [Gammaproteobacteria bacterium]|nr:class I SAM-dependent methyltransferase [Gammaproteobacteria bacterium]MCI0590170.1 class I SAM-dependent methyltransferase [Gammaproteobacteria bacterium]
MARKSITLTDTLHEYLISVSLRESDVLKKLRQETAKYPMAEMQIAPEQGQFMSILIQIMGATKALEVGVFTGYSSICIALALPAEGRLIACDINEEWTAVAQRYWRQAGVAEKIELVLAPGLNTMDRLLESGEGSTFDFIFIDAEKANYLGYYERSLKLLRRGGLLLVDNVLWSGRVADPSEQDLDTVAIRIFNEQLHQDDRIAISMLPVADGLTLAVKR